MGKKPNDTDSVSVRMEKKSKKNRNITSDIDVGVPKEKSHKHKEKKRKSESIEDEDEGRHDRHDKNRLVNNGDLQKKDKKKKKKRDSSDPAQIEKDEPCQNDGADLERETDKKSQSQKSDEDEEHDKGNLGNDRDLQKKDKKKKRKRDSSDTVQIEENEPAQNEGPDLERVSDRQSQNSRSKDMFEKNEKKKKKKTDSQNSDTETNRYVTEESNIKDSQDHKRKKVGNKVKKSTESVENNTEEPKKSTESVENNTEKPKEKRKSKKVSWSGHDEVIPTSDTKPEKKKPKTDGLIRGKRFTPEEDAIVKEAVLNYVTAHDLGDEGLNMVLNCRSYPGMKKCWQEIGTCIPYRPYGAVYHRGHALFEKGGDWAPEEIESLKELHEKYGNNWKKMGAELGKHRFRVKDTWRRVKLANIKKGKWSQDEYQNLYDLVNLDLQMKLNSEKKSKHGMLRDNIPWTAISDKLTTRHDATCCMKWYRQLTSSLVVENKWSDADDYRMIGVLYELDATCAEDVDWENVLEHRPGDICRKRWDQMVKHIGHQGSKPFAEQVDILAKRYCPDLAETREAWDNKEVVD